MSKKSSPRGRASSCASEEEPIDAFEADQALAEWGDKLLRVAGAQSDTLNHQDEYGVDSCEFEVVMLDEEQPPADSHEKLVSDQSLVDGDAQRKDQRHLQKLMAMRKENTDAGSLAGGLPNGCSDADNEVPDNDMYQVSEEPADADDEVPDKDMYTWDEPDSKANAAHESQDASVEKVTTKAETLWNTTAASIRGIVGLRGSFVVESTTLCDVLCGALVETLRGYEVNVSVVVHRELMDKDEEGSDRRLGTEFEFVVQVADSSALAPAAAVLNLEAACGGALQLLPAIAESQLLEGGRVAVRLQVQSVEDMSPHGSVT